MVSLYFVSQNKQKTWRGKPKTELRQKIQTLKVTHNKDDVKFADDFFFFVRTQQTTPVNSPNFQIPFMQMHL